MPINAMRGRTLSAQQGCKRIFTQRPVRDPLVQSLAQSRQTRARGRVCQQAHSHSALRSRRKLTGAEGVQLRPVPCDVELQALEPRPELLRLRLQPRRRVGCLLLLRLEPLL